MLGFLLADSITRTATTPAPTGLNQNLTEINELKKRIDSLELACAGLWELLKFKTGATEDELAKAIEAVDARDGEVDGKIRRTVGNCPSCKRKLALRRAPNCAWCGAPVKLSPF